MQAAARLSTIVVAALLANATNAQVPCGADAGFTLQDGNTTRNVRRIGNVLVFRSGMKVNTDGAANSYHPIGTSRGALNTICNGIAVTPRAGPWAGRRISATRPAGLTREQRCQMILDIFRQSREHDYAIGADGEIDWFAIATRSPQGGKYRPCIQESGPFAGFFVAQTSRAADPSKEVCDPARWISSTEIPYITLPGNRLEPHGVTPGDLALVHRRVGNQEHLIVAVAGDTGNQNELGEGSIALHVALGSPAVGRIPNNIVGGVTTFVFPGRRAERPITPASLEMERNALVGLVGGPSAVATCGS